MNKVTVIVPVFNAEETIDKCLESILNQTYRNLEILIINDGSTDRTGDICEKYAKADSRIRIFHQENKGVSAARNIGIEHADGKYIQFVDADDYIEATMTEILIKRIESKQAEWVICGCMEDKDGTQTVISTRAKPKMNQTEVLRALLEPDSIRGYLVNKLFCNEIIKRQKQRLRTDIHVCEDLIFCLEYGACVTKALYLDETLYHYVYRNNSVTHKRYSPKRFSVIQAFEEIKKITEKYQDTLLDKKVEAHYLVLVIQLFVMLKRNHISMGSKEMKLILENMKKRKLGIWFTHWDFKYKVVCIPIKLLSMIYG